MGSARRAEHRRAAREAAKHRSRRLHGWDGWTRRDDVATQVAWCDGSTDGIEEAKRETHDRLIENLGESRTGGVRWWIGEPCSAAIVEHLMDGNADEALGNYYRQIAGLVREHGGVVVMAGAPAVHA